MSDAPKTQPETETVAIETTAKPQPSKSAKQYGTQDAQREEFPFSVRVGLVYDGPLDLLLDLVRKQNIDIYDIPIGQITQQYLQYVEHIKQLDVDVAAEFIYMASLLIQIKSRMLLPKDPDAKDGQDDPRMELVNRLLEHERFKTAAQMLMQKQQIEEAVWSNPSLKDFKDAEGTEPEMAAEVIDLVRTFQQILDRAKERPVLSLNEESVTVGQMIEYVRRRLMVEDKPVLLKSLLRNVHSRQALICAFLAILELIRLQAVLAKQDAVFSDIVLKKHTTFDSIVVDSESVRDDWK
jgi:segregation and condensation protein A